MGKTRCSTEIIFEKNEFYVGETIRVRIICDNTVCKKNVESFKFKIIRKIKGYESYKVPGAWAYSECWVDSIFFEDQCKKHEKIDKVFKIKIPDQDWNPMVTNYVPISEEEKPLLKSFTCSVSAKLF